MVRELTFAEGERMRKRVIALDIGNVCLEIHPERCFAALGYRSAQEIPPEALFLASERFERVRRRFRLRRCFSQANGLSAAK